METALAALATRPWPQWAEAGAASSRAGSMTQEQVAEALGVSRQAVSKWENGTAEPSTSNLLALARLYGVDLSWEMAGTCSMWCMGVCLLSCRVGLIVAETSGFVYQLWAQLLVAEGILLVFPHILGPCGSGRPNDETHPAFGAALREAAESGVGVYAYDCLVTPDSLAIRRPVEAGHALDLHKDGPLTVLQAEVEPGVLPGDPVPFFSAGVV